MDHQILLKVGESKNIYGKELYEKLIILSTIIVKGWYSTSRSFKQMLQENADDIIIFL